MRFGSHRVGRVVGTTLLILSLLTSCSVAVGRDEPPPTGTYSGPPPIQPVNPTKIGFITDFGNCDSGTAAVADMVKSWDAAAIVTGGDNTQTIEDCVPYVQSVMDYYGDRQIGPEGPIFFPALGNHDYYNEGAGLDAYRKAFPFLPADADLQRRYYEQRVGNVRFFILDSELEGDENIEQQVWLENALKRSKADYSDAAWRVVVFHRPAFSSGTHGPRLRMQPQSGWDYQGWGADLVLSGHQHIYEDVLVDGLHYLTVGPGSSELPRECPAATDRTTGSRTCVEGAGAALVKADASALTVEFHQPIDGQDKVTDSLTLNKAPV